MRCFDFEELLSNYANDEISRTQREFIEEHLSDCAGCRKTLAGYVSVRQHLSALNDIQHKPDLKEAVMSKIKGINAGSTARKLMRPALVSLPVIAIMVALLIIQPWNTTNGPKGVLAKVITSSENIQSYRVVNYSSTTHIYQLDATPTISERVWEFVLPDRVHATFYNSYNSTSNGVITRIEETSEFFIIGESLYYLADNDIDMSLENSSVYAYAGGIPTKEYVLGLLQFMFELRQLPDENIDGVDCLHYEGIPKLGNIPCEIWIDKDDYLVRQITQKHEDERTISTYSTRYYDFNADITIEPPVTASGELLPGWEVEDFQLTLSLIPVDEAINAITGNEDWTDPAVLSKVLEMIVKVTDPMAYFNALPPEAQEALNDFLANLGTQGTTTTTTIVVGLDYRDGILHYSNSSTGQDVVIDTGEVNGEISGGDTTAVVNLWVSAILAPDPQAYFDSLPEETRRAMVGSLSDNSMFKLMMDALAPKG